MKLFRRVILESPFGHANPQVVDIHRQYLLWCLRHCLLKKDSPYASHKLLTEVLDDNEQSQRTLGINAGFAWTQSAEAIVVYTDLGISIGMKKGIKRARKLGIPIEYREICSMFNAVRLLQATKHSLIQPPIE